MIASDLVRELFDYRDGHLYWRKKTNRNHVITRPAGTINVTGYRVVTINGKKIHAHRLIWLWHGLELPQQIDHINGDPADNRIENLRAADYMTNAYNSRIKSDNTSGVKNVSWCNTYQRWVVQLRAAGKKVSGRFKTKEEAAMFARAKRKELHGEFACEGVR
jgi:hypothetical protein